jgi:3-mercaptopyruvate sulfurtransferase SseA
MRGVLFSIAAAGVLFASGGAARAAESDPFGSLTIDQVADHLAKKDASIYDNNPADMYKKGHVPTATWVDFKNVTASDLPQDKDRTLVFYCANER